MGIDNAAARAKSAAQDVFAFGQRQADRAMPPQARQKAYEGVGALAQEKPILFSLVATHLLFAALPLLCFATFALSVAGAALAGALLFVLFWTGAALLLFLAPALLLASAAALLVWLWAVAAFLVARRALSAYNGKTATATATAPAVRGEKRGGVYRENGADGGGVEKVKEETKQEEEEEEEEGEEATIRTEE